MSPLLDDVASVPDSMGEDVEIWGSSTGNLSPLVHLIAVVRDRSCVAPRTPTPRLDASDEDGLLSVNYAGFAPVLVEGLKELKSKQQLDTEGLQDLVGRQKVETERLLEELERKQRLETTSLRELAHQQSRQLRNIQREWAARDFQQSRRLTRAQKRIDGLEQLVKQQASQLGHSYKRLRQLEDALQHMSSESLYVQQYQ